MLIVEENIQLWYREYKKQFEKSKKWITSRGGQIRFNTPSNYTDFKTDFLTQVTHNPTKSGKQIAQKIAKEEAFSVTTKQAEKAAEFHARKEGVKLTQPLVNKFRLNLFEQTEEYRRTDPEMRGKTTYGQNKLIAQHFFGSE